MNQKERKYKNLSDVTIHTEISGLSLGRKQKMEQRGGEESQICLSLVEIHGEIPVLYLTLLDRNL